MVQLRPNHFVDTGSKGEKILFDKFAALTGAENWIVLHSLDIFGDVNYGEGEADLLVLMPGLGALVIEVKSHERVELRNGSWYLGNELDKRGPVKQAKNAKYAINRWLVEAGIQTHDVPFYSCVWFTSANNEKVKNTIEWQPWTLLYAADLTKNLKQVLESLMKQSIEFSQNQGRNFGRDIAPTAKMIEIANALRPNFVVNKSPDQRRQDIQKALMSATSEQAKVIEVVSGHVDKYLLPGGAGTGKTHLALLEAKKAHQAGLRTLVVCFNSLLATYLKEELADFSNVTVQTLHSFMLEASGTAVPANQDAAWWQESLPDQACNALLGFDEMDKFDFLIIDEAQDLGLTSYLDVMGLALAGGYKNGKVAIFGDFTHQAVYLPGAASLANYKATIPNLVSLGELRANCRNTREIGSFVTTFSSLDKPYSEYRRTDAGPRPQLMTGENQTKLLSLLKEELSRLLKKYKAEDIVILSTEKELLDALIQKTNVPHSPISMGAKSKVRWGTIQAFKGLESPAVVLVEFSESRHATLDTFYVGSTRATLELTCIYDAKLAKDIFTSK